MFKISSKGNWSKTSKFFKDLVDKKYMDRLDEYAKLGVEALSASTPVDTGKTASSWTYEIEKGPNSTTIRWLNTNVQDHVNIAIILQYGHGTGTGGYVQGIDYINPAMRPIFEHIADKAWKEVWNL